MSGLPPRVLISPVTYSIGIFASSPPVFTFHPLATTPAATKQRWYTGPRHAYARLEPDLYSFYYFLFYWWFTIILRCMVREPRLRRRISPPLTLRQWTGLITVNLFQVFYKLYAECFLLLFLKKKNFFTIRLLTGTTTVSMNSHHALPIIPGRQTGARDTSPSRAPVFFSLWSFV